jgi:hypothetical protein
MAEPSTPIEAYKALIDELVNETRESIAADCVREEGIYQPVGGPEPSVWMRETLPEACEESAAREALHSEQNHLIASLTPRGRELLALMLEEERTGAIHDVLAVLTWWMPEVALTYKGREMPVELSGMGLHGDFVGRIQGWEWPDTPRDSG